MTSNNRKLIITLALIVAMGHLGDLSAENRRVIATIPASLPSVSFTPSDGAGGVLRAPAAVVERDLSVGAVSGDLKLPDAEVPFRYIAPIDNPYFTEDLTISADGTTPLSLGPVTKVMKTAPVAEDRSPSADGKKSAFLGHIKEAETKGLFKSGTIFDAAHKTASSHEPLDAGPEAPAKTKLSTKEALTAIKERAAANEPVYFLISSGHHVPMKGDIHELVKSGRLTIYREDSAGMAPTRYIAQLSDKEWLEAYGPKLNSLALEAMTEGANIHSALDQLVRSVRLRSSEKSFLEVLADTRHSMKGYVASRNEWKEKRDALYAKAKGDDKFFLKAVLDGADFKKSHTDLSIGSLMAESFPNADALLAAFYPEDIEELRHFIPKLSGASTRDFENSIFIDPELTLEFLENRRTFKKGGVEPVSYLSEIGFEFSSKDIPPLLARLASREGGSLKPFEAELRELAAESLPVLERLDGEVRRLEDAIHEGNSGKVNAQLKATVATVRDIQSHSGEWQKWRNKRNSLLERAREIPAVRHFLEAATKALDPNRSTLDSLISNRYRNADELLAAFYPEDIEELRRFIPRLSRMGVQGFERSFFIDKESVLEFIAALNRFAQSGRQALIENVDNLLEIPYLVALDEDEPKAKAKSGEYLLPYHIPGIADIVDFEPPISAPVKLRPDMVAEEQKDSLRERVRAFDDLIESNFRILPMMGNLGSKPKSVARVVMTEMGKMVASYAALARSAGSPDEGKRVSEKYNALAAELEELWRDMPDTQPLSAELAARVGVLEQGLDLPRLRNLHSLVNYMHKKSLKLLGGDNQGGGSGRISSDNHHVVFTNLREEPLVRQGRLRSAPLASLSSRLGALQPTWNDRMIINGNEAWYHAVLGKHNAEIYVRFAHPDDGGMLRIRYEDWETANGKRPRLALLEAQLQGLGISHEVEEDQYLTAVLDKDHGLRAESDLRELFPMVIQTLHDDSELNRYFVPMKPKQSEEMVRMMADLYLAEGGWPAKDWNDPSAFARYYKTYAARERQAHRKVLRAGINSELKRLALPTIPDDASFGQAVIRRYFTDVIQKALMMGHLKMDDDGIPQAREFRPVEGLADAVLADADEARRLASLTRSISADLEFEPIGAIGALRAERAILKFGRQGIVFYGLHDPETGFIGYARVQGYDHAKLTDLTTRALTDLLIQQGIEASPVEPLSEAQAAILDEHLRAPVMESPVLGARTLGLAASPGPGGFVTARATFDRRGKPGSTLIVPFTEPDDLNTMQKSVAVVTTGGGLLSHAAITTRELGVRSVILPTASWRKNPDGSDSVEITLYQSDAKARAYRGLSLNPKLSIRRIRVKEGDFVRVNGATGELSLFPERGEDIARALRFIERFHAGGNSPVSLTPSAADFAIEEVLFNADFTGDIQTKIMNAILHYEDAEVRDEALSHGRRLLEYTAAHN